MTKIPDKAQAYWQQVQRTAAQRFSKKSAEDQIPEVIEVQSERLEDDEPDGRSPFVQFFDRFKQTEPASELAAGKLEEKIEEKLEAQDQGQVAQVFQRYLRRVKPEDIEKIKARLGEMQRGPVKEVWTKVQALAKMMKDPNAAWKSKAVAIAALVYLISPFDAVPDVIPFVGLLDDVA
ncbi:MAG: YkvA family protein, partial [Limnothrix sp.]